MFLFDRTDFAILCVIRDKLLDLVIGGPLNVPLPPGRALRYHEAAAGHDLGPDRLRTRVWRPQQWPLGHVMSSKINKTNGFHRFSLILIDFY